MIVRLRERIPTLGILAAIILALLVSALPLHAQEGGGEAEEAEAPPPPARKVRQSWIADRRAFAVGDVITVMIDEFTLASANLGNTNTDNRRRQNDVAFNVRSRTASTGTSVGFNSTNNGEQVQRGEATRQNRFQSEMTVRVAEVLPNGVLRIEGMKLVNVDRNKQEVVLSGFVRPQDIGPFNQVDSWRVGELRVDYKHDGAMGKPKGGMLGRIVGMVWP
jgi:flagellar L-ring protein precursor FlgH